MSKERARRRAEREAAAAAERERRAKEQARAARRRAVTGRLSSLTAPFRTAAEPGSALARQRRRQNGVLAAALVALNAVLWLLEPSWAWRAATVVGSVVAWPLLAVLAFDRRATR